MNTKIKRPYIQHEKNPNWKGEKASFRVIHKWVVRYLGQPDICEFCGRTGLTSHQIEWANKSGEYKRELTDWIRLCVPCHRNFDKIRRNKKKFVIKFFRYNLEFSITRRY